MKATRNWPHQTPRAILGRAAFGISIFSVLVLLSHACSPVTRDITIVDDASGGYGGSGDGDSGGSGDGDGDSGGSDGTGGQDGSGGSLISIMCTVDGDCPALQPQCAEGFCVGCSSNSDCGDSSPVCEGGLCRPCEANDECETEACSDAGTCVPEDSAVFALAQTGSLSADCGTQDLPCRFLNVAAEKLSEERPNLVFVPTNQAFSDDNMTLPDDIGITIYGNDVSFVHSGPQPIVKQGGSLTLIGMNISGFDDPDQTLVTAIGAGLFLRESILSHSGIGVHVEDGAVHVEGSRFEAFVRVGVSMTCGAETCSPGAIVERSYFRDIPDAIEAWMDNTVIRNNIFDRVAHEDYARGVNLKAVAEGATVSFNTFYRSGNCSFTGLVACDGEGATVFGNLSVDSTIDVSDPPCFAQVYVGCVDDETNPSPNPNTLTYALSEAPYPGEGNITGDAMLADPENGDFRLLEGSDAINAGPAADVPSEDYYGNPRPVGSSSDIGAHEFQ